MNRFIDLFFRNQKKAVETFEAYIKNHHYYSESSSVSTITVSGFFDDKTKKTIPFPTDWRLKVGISSASFATVFQEPKKTTPTTYGSWIKFLKEASTETLKEDQADDNNFFWDQFFEAYLYFVGLSKTDPYSDESFLLFLENITTGLINNLTTQLFNLQKSKFLQYVPGVDPTSVGEDGLDLTAIWNLDPNTFTLKDLNPTITRILSEYEGYAVFALNTSRNQASKLNIPYRDNIVLLKSLVEQKDFWTILNRILKNNFGIKFLFNNGEYNLENLISSFSHYDSSETINNFISLATNQFREELTKLIFANKNTIQNRIDTFTKLLEVFNQTKTQLLTRLQVALETLQKFDPTTTHLPINGGKYAINQLLPATDKLLNSDFKTAEAEAVAQINELFSNQIYASDIIKAIDQLKKYKEIVPFLTKLATEQKLTSLKIKDRDYSFTSLLTDAKKQFADFAKDSLDELQKLIEGKIIVSQLETTYQESLSSSSTENKSTPKKSTNQNLAIGLGTAGAVVALAGAGGFAYWFVKIRKS